LFFSRLITISIAILLIITCVPKSQAEPLTPYKFKRYSVEDGLSQGTILSMYQDSTGYIWLGTENGLNRFDGYEFLRINNILGHDVRAITGDSDGNLWIGTTEALNFLKEDSNEFESFSSSNQPLLLSSNIQSLLLASDNTLWVGTNKGLYIKKADNNITPINIENSSVDLSKSFIVSITKIKNGVIWIGTGEGLFEINTNNNTQKKIILSDKINIKNIRAVFINSQKDIWIATFGSGLFRTQYGVQEVFHYKAPDLVEDKIYAIAEDSEGRMWFGMDTQGIEIFEYGKGFHLLTHESSDPQSLSGNAIEKILLGNNGDIWVGTTRTGLNQHKLLSRQFTHLKHRKKSALNLPSNDVISIAQDKKSNIWIGTFGEGWSVINLRANTINHISPKDSLDGNHPIAVIIGTEGYNWLFTESSITKVDSTSLKIIKSFNVAKDLMQTGQPKKPVLDFKGNIWYSHENFGLTKLDQQKEIFTHYNTKNSDLPSNIIDALLTVPNGDIWIAHRDGLSLFSPIQNTFETYSINETGKNHYVNDFLLDKYGILWIATPNSLIQFDTISKQFISHNTHLNSPNISISKLLIDSEETVWASSNKGVFQLLKKKSTLVNFTKEDGLQAGEFNAGVGIILSNGTLAFGGVEGVSIFNPQNLKSYKNSIHFSSIVKQATSGNKLLEVSSHIDTITLEDDTVNLVISLTTLGYSTPNRIKYRYRELNGSWIYAQSNTLNISTSISGEFTYEIAVTDSLGNWQSDNQRKLNIIVPALWYKTSIMIFIYLCSFIALVFLFFKLREKKLKFESNRLEILVQERTLSLAQSNEKITIQAEELKLAATQKKKLYETISHELRTPITLILGPIQQLRKNVTGKNLVATATLIERNATRLNHLVNQLLDLSRTESILNKKTDKTNISDLAKNLVSSFNPYASDANIKLTLTTYDNLWVDINLDDTEKLLSNIITNAIKYSNLNDSVLVSIKKDEEFIIINVEDTGIGINPDHVESIFTRFYRIDSEQTKAIEGSGIGLSIVKSIVNKANGSITVDSELYKGTTFSVKLPISKGLSSIKPIEQHLQQKRIDDKLASNLPLLLLIDDNEDILTYVSSVLANDYHITTASNGQEGIEAARTIIPDIIISDVMMPGIDGLELLETLKNDELTNHIPIILLTAKGSDESKIKGLKLHADDYISKPFNEYELSLRLRNILDARDILKKKFAAEIMIETQPPIKKDKPAFIVKLDSIIEKHYQVSSFSVAELAKEAAVGERQLLRKLKATADVGAKEYIRTYRLKKAAELLHQGNTATFVAAEVGFSSAAYFSNCFKAFYGLTPSQYINSTINDT